MNRKKLIIIALIFIVLIIIVGIIILLKAINTDKNNLQQEEQYYVLGDGIYEKTEGINESAIINNINKINNVCENYLNDMKIYFALIPNKEYYLSDESDIEFNKIQETIQKQLYKNTTYIELYDTLKLDDYYKTDMHWKQENLNKTLERILQEMNVKNIDVEYETESLGEFYGSYYKEINNTDIKPDKLIYLTNSMIENCIVYNQEKEEEEKIYNKTRVNETNNKYDVFLSGAAAIQSIENEKVNNGKKLILFRDSFGSSIAPLLVANYEEILLIDIRYVNSNVLTNYIDFTNYKNADVLFLYNTRVINKSGIFR